MKQIPNYPDYQITKSGMVWSNKRHKFLKPAKQKQGYLYISLCKNGKIFTKKIHRLVLETFVGSCPSGMECCHNNGIPDDNRLSNLRWDTRSNNHNDALKHGTHQSLHQNGEQSPSSKLTEKDVKRIRRLYKTELFTQKEIAKTYNIHQTTIHYIVTRKRWKYI